MPSFTRLSSLKDPEIAEFFLIKKKYLLTCMRLAMEALVLHIILEMHILPSISDNTFPELEIRGL